MFGYVVPKKCELRVKELNLYRAYYCSVCKELKDLGPFAKATLNYDFTFMALIAAAISQKSAQVVDRRCTTNPLSKKAMVKSSSFISLVACASILSVRYKLLDDIKDEKILKKILSLVIYFGLQLSFAKAKRLFPEIDMLIKHCSNEQMLVEKQNECSVDRAAEPTSYCLGKLFEMVSSDEQQKRILFRLGYYTGKYVYCSDMLDDLEQDIKSNSFNPLIYSNALDKNTNGETVKNIIQDYRPQLNIINCEIAKTYNLLEINSLKPIIDNIIFLGMPESINQLGAKKKGNKINAQSI